MVFKCLDGKYRYFYIVEGRESIHYRMFKKEKCWGTFYTIKMGQLPKWLSANDFEIMKKELLKGGE